MLKKFYVVVELLVTAATVAAVTSCASQSTLKSTAQEVKVDSGSQTNLPIDTAKILDSHNFIRQRLGVPPLRWSTRLESFATDWVNYLTGEAGCVVRRRGLIGLPLQKNGIGENLQRHDAIRFGDGRTEVAQIDERDLVLQWAREAVNYDYKSNKCKLNEECESYTQLVWRDSQVLGCAAASCPNNDQIWVCNYDPPGNYAQQKPY